MVCAVCNFLAPEYKIWVPVLFYGREKMYMNNNTKKITTTAMLAAIAYRLCGSGGRAHSGGAFPEI